MKRLLLASLLLGGCVKPAAAPPPAAPTPPASPSHMLAAGDDPWAPKPVADKPPPIVLEETDGLDDPPPPPEGDDMDDLDGEPNGVLAEGPDPDIAPPGNGDLAMYLAEIPGKGPLVAKISTSMGEIHCELLPDKAPLTVANFIGLATGKKAWRDPKTGSKQEGKPFYNGLIFHRVIPEFGIQSGDPLGQGTGGPGYSFADEVNNGLTMQPGTLLMANAGPSTNGSQFFITEGSPEHLTNRHTIFGRCKELPLIKRIARVPKDPRDRPITPITIKSIAFSRGGAAPRPPGKRPRAR